MKIHGPIGNPNLLNITLVGDTTLNNDATVDFTGLNLYDNYIIEIEDLVPQTDSVQLHLRVSHDNGSTFESGVSDYKWGIRVDNNLGSANTADTADSEINLITSNVSNLLGTGTGESYTAEVWIHHMGEGAPYFGLTLEGIGRNAFPATGHNFGWGLYVAQTNKRVNAIRIFTSSGNLASGRIRVYGIKI